MALFGRFSHPAKQHLGRLLKEWALPLSMLAGVVCYFSYSVLPCREALAPYAQSVVSVAQPLLIFSMLFVAFCKVEISALRLSRWHGLLLLAQFLMFFCSVVALSLCLDSVWRIGFECVLLCFICPTATAAAVVAAKLGGSAASLISYTIASNLLAAISVPLLLPMAQIQGSVDFLSSLTLILSRVFPLLICPLLVATFVRYCFPRFHRWILAQKDLAFRIWIVALALAIALTTQALVHTRVSGGLVVLIAVVSLLSCLLQFLFGRLVGKHYGEPISAAQALGQKNTVFAIWLAYTFLSPVTALAGGFYSVWHNVINSIQLRQAMRAKSSDE